MWEGIGIFSTVVNVALLVSIDACALALDGIKDQSNCAADWLDAFEMISNSSTLTGLVISFVVLSTAWNIMLVSRSRVILARALPRWATV